MAYNWVNSFNQCFNNAVYSYNTLVMTGKRSSNQCFNHVINSASHIAYKWTSSSTNVCQTVKKRAYKSQPICPRKCAGQLKIWMDENYQRERVSSRIAET